MLCLLGVVFFMSNLLREINPTENLDKNVFDLISNSWMLITAGDSKKLNTMTASWGCFGSLWGKFITMCFIRPERYTFKFIESNDFYTLSFYNDKYRDVLKYCGTHSGRDVDKIRNTNLTAVFDEKAPYFKESSLVFICKKIYSDYMYKKNFTNEEIQSNICNAWYRDSDSADFHKFYIGEIVKVLSR